MCVCIWVECVHVGASSVPFVHNCILTSLFWGLWRWQIASKSIVSKGHLAVILSLCFLILHKIKDLFSESQNLDQTYRFYCVSHLNHLHHRSSCLISNCLSSTVAPHPVMALFWIFCINPIIIFLLYKSLLFVDLKGPRPDGLCSPSIEFWISSQLDIPRPPFNSKEQRLYSKLPPDVRVPNPVSEAEPGHLVEDCIPRSHFPTTVRYSGYCKEINLT